MLLCYEETAAYDMSGSCYTRQAHIDDADFTIAGFIRNTVRYNIICY